MKINKMKVEIVTEFAKELVFERRENVFGDQNYIFAEQTRRIKRLEDHQLDFVITDSPMPLPVFYDDRVDSHHFPAFVFSEFNKFNNVNYLLRRRHTFEVFGRRHNENDAIRIDQELEQFLIDNNVDYTAVDAHPTTPEIILQDIRRRMPGPVGLPFTDMPAG